MLVNVFHFIVSALDAEECERRAREKEIEVCQCFILIRLIFDFITDHYHWCLWIYIIHIGLDLLNFRL